MKKLHPITAFVYYITIMMITLFTMNPILLGCSLLGAVLFYRSQHSRVETMIMISKYMVLFVLITVTNPLFSHRGETVLFFLNGRPITKEALYYGMAIGSMMVSIFLWCQLFYEIMTTDQYIYLFGKVMPKGAMILSMALRFIPSMKKQTTKILEAQKTMGLYSGEAYIDRILGRIRAFDSVITWSLEHGVDTADAMKARGYGIRKRTNFSIFVVRTMDRVLLLVIGIVLMGVLHGALGESFMYAYYPVVTDLTWNGMAVVHYVCVMLIMMIPFLIQMKENLQWNLLKSRI